MCCPVERVAAVEAIGDLPNLPEISKCGRIAWNGTYYDTPKYVIAEIDDYMDMAHEVTNNIDIEDEQFGEELFDLMGATGNFVNMDTNDLLSRAEELRQYTERKNFHGGLAKKGQFNFVARLEYDTFSKSSFFITSRYSLLILLFIACLEILRLCHFTTSHIKICGGGK